MLKQYRTANELKESEINRLKTQLDTALSIISDIDNSPGQIDNKDNDEQIDYQSIVPRAYEGVLFGGHINWQRKLKTVFPQFQCFEADDKTFDPNVMAKYESIYIVSGHLSHSAYYRIKVNLKSGQKIIPLSMSLRDAIKMIIDTEEKKQYHLKYVEQSD